MRRLPISSSQVRAKATLENLSPEPFGWIPPCPTMPRTGKDPNGGSPPAEVPPNPALRSLHSGQSHSALECPRHHSDVRRQQPARAGGIVKYSWSILISIQRLFGSILERQVSTSERDSSAQRFETGTVSSESGFVHHPFSTDKRKNGAAKPSISQRNRGSYQPA